MDITTLFLFLILFLVLAIYKIYSSDCYVKNADYLYDQVTINDLFDELEQVKQVPSLVIIYGIEDSLISAKGKKLYREKMLQFVDKIKKEVQDND